MDLERLEYINLFFKENEKTKEYEIRLKALDRERMFLYKEFADYLEFLKIKGTNNLEIESIKNQAELTFSSEYDGYRIKIYIPDILPNIYTKTRSEAAGYFSEQWKIEIANSIGKLKESKYLKYDKVFIWIKLFNSVPCDCDNKLIKPIIDGIYRSGIIKDDNISVVKFLVEGHTEKENPHTEVFIFGNENIPKLIENSIN